MAVQSIPPQQGDAASQKAKPSMTPEQIAIVKSTAPILKEHGVTITSHFYSTMLDAHPALHNIFNRANQATGDQPRALAGLVFAFASHVDNLAVLEAGIRRVAHKHVSLQVQPDQYAIVGEYLIAAVAHVLGPDVVTAAVADAWIAAYAVLADIFISLEADLYRANQDRTDPEGHRVWPAEGGWRPFKIQRRVDESGDAGIASFYLVPAPQDGGADSETQPPLPAFKPGQYISLRIPVPELGGVLQPRQYSLSDAPGKAHYRISVKRERGAAQEQDQEPLHPGGLVSNILHDKYREGDIVELTYPMGEFHPTTTGTTTAEAVKPLVLISAGVGVTPMVSILDTAVLGSTGGDALQQQKALQRRPVTWIHGAHSASARAFHEHVAQTLASAATTTTAEGEQREISSHLFLTIPDDSSSSSSSEAEAAASRQHNYTGRIDLAKIPQGRGGLYLDQPTAAAEYYICGPLGFMDAARAYLVEEKGVDEARVFREVFGTGN
ncbi:hypothetical protein Micbo1qcDRAFT_164953 [Microdochium bolleyi]|uniref:nitric oxide dioxygenase n=1 Tax=Microdochium bolleyi TaxID=196109 RepID=A0A136IXL4_9PEZI|nr:hypothetical protein Micbo1qcDRAFT_164953 [Microdochium bolleyi]